MACSFTANTFGASPVGRSRGFSIWSGPNKQYRNRPELPRSCCGNERFLEGRTQGFLQLHLDDPFSRFEQTLYDRKRICKSQGARGGGRTRGIFQSRNFPGRSGSICPRQGRPPPPPPDYKFRRGGFLQGRDPTEPAWEIRSMPIARYSNRLMSRPHQREPFAQSLQPQAGQPIS